MNKHCRTLNSLQERTVKEVHGRIYSTFIRRGYLAHKKTDVRAGTSSDWDYMTIQSGHYRNGLPRNLQVQNRRAERLVWFLLFYSTDVDFKVQVYWFY